MLAGRSLYKFAIFLLTGRSAKVVCYFIIRCSLQPVGIFNNVMFNLN